MKCSLCGCKFGENQAEKACNGCLLAKNCKLVKCPNCGYEMSPEPAWLKKILQRRNVDGTC